jgi:hypothetical protein
MHRCTLRYGTYVVTRDFTRLASHLCLAQTLRIHEQPDVCFVLNDGPYGTTPRWQLVHVSQQWSAPRYTLDQSR